jgi:fumarylacetoacetase
MEGTPKRTWVQIQDHSDFTIHNLPYGIFRTQNREPRAGVAIGDYVLDLAALAKEGFLNELHLDKAVFSSLYLNDFIALGKPAWQSVRSRVTELLTEGNTELEKYVDQVLLPRGSVELLMPVKVGDYTDFYSSEEHATNVGKMFRGAENALMPNWKSLPVAYHGRSSSIVVSGTDIIRPKGQMKPADAQAPSFGPSKRMDFELEVAFVIGKATQMGQTIPTEAAEDHIFGFVLFNDWSARDIQQWEYQPLGPFLGKNFASSVSPWVVPMAALDPFRTPGRAQYPEVLPYLKYKGHRNFDISLEVALQPENGEEIVVCRSNFKYLYWNICQQLAHHTVNGCNVNVGDLMASGTISGPVPGSYGSLLELTLGGKNPLKLSNGTERRFLEDNDTVIMRGHAEKGDIRIGFGEVRGKLLEARG